MSLQGKILSIYNKGKYAKVSVKPVINCNGCKVCAGLIKSSTAVNDEREVEALTNNLNINVGDYVKLELSEYQGTKAALLIYGLPILGFLTGMLLAPYISIFLKIELTDLVRIVCAFAGLFISLHLLFLYLKIKKPETFMMQITEVIQQ